MHLLNNNWALEVTINAPKVAEVHFCSSSTACMLFLFISCFASLPGEQRMMGTRRGGANVSSSLPTLCSVLLCLVRKTCLRDLSVKTIPIIVALFSLSQKKIYLKPKNQYRVLLESECASRRALIDMYGGEVIPREATHTITVLYLHFKSPTVHLADSIYLFIFCFFPPPTKKKLSDALKALLRSARRRLEGGGGGEQKGL